MVLGDYQGCLSAHQTHNWFMYAWVRGCGGPPEGWRGWMSASGGAAMSGTGLTVSDDQHFVMESVPFHTTDYDAVVYGPARYRLGRPRTARALGWITAGGRRMRWVLVSPQTSGSFMAGHLMLVWATRSHTYALGFHILPPGGQPVAAALDRAVASRLVMVRPGHQHPRAAGTAGG